MSESSHLEEDPVPDRKNAPLSAWERGEMPEVAPVAEWSHHRLKKRVRLTDIYSENRKEKSYFERVMSGEPDAAASGGAGVTAVSPQEWLMGEFQKFLTSLSTKLASQVDTPEVPVTEVSKPRIRPIRTPRSEIPLAAARPAELMRPEFAKGRLYFSCPCCRFPAALPVWLAGKKARCPRCYSAIRAPHPRKGLNTRVFENDVESILHPERFSEYRGAHRLIPFLGLPRPKFQPSFNAAAVAVLVMALMLFIPALLQSASRKAASASAPAQETWTGDPDYKGRARSVVEKFLAAETIAAKASFVRDPQRVTPLMTDWYGRFPGQARIKPESVAISGAGFYSDGLQYPVSDVCVETAEGAEEFFSVEHYPDGDLIEWESSVGYNADFASLIARAADTGPQVIRVMATLDDYYNFNFTDPNTHLCVRLHDPSTLDLLGYGYIPANVEAAGALASQLAGSSIEDLRPLMIEVQPTVDAAKSRQVSILRMVEAGWRTSEMAAAR